MLMGASSFLALVAVVAGVAVQPAHAEQVVQNQSNPNLGDLLVLDRLFSGNEKGSILSGDGSKTDLGDLFILNQLFGGTNGIVPGLGGNKTVAVQSGDTLSAIALRQLGDATRYPEIAAANNIANPNLIFPGQRLVIPTASTGNGILSGNGTNLGDLFILDKLFNNGDGGILNSSNGSDLGDLFVLDRLFSGNGTNGNGTGILGGNSLGQLFVLDRLFGDNGGGLFDKSGNNNLGDLFILDRLFGNGTTSTM